MSGSGSYYADFTESVKGITELARSVLTDDGTGIKFDKLAKLLVSTGVTVIALGFSGVINASVAAVVGLYDGVASFLSALLRAGAGVIIEPSAHAWALSTSAVAGFTSVWTPVFVLAVVLAYLYIARWGDG